MELVTPSMDERLRRIESQIDELRRRHAEFTGEMREFVGKMGAMVESQTQFINNVNMKLTSHLDDEKKAFWHEVQIVAGFLSGIVALGIELIRKR